MFMTIKERKRGERELKRKYFILRRRKKEKSGREKGKCL